MCDASPRRDEDTNTPCFRMRLTSHMVLPAKGRAVAYLNRGSSLTAVRSLDRRLCRPVLLRAHDDPLPDRSGDETGRRAGSAVREAVEAESARARRTASDRARRLPSESRPGSAGGASPPASASPVDAQEKTEDSLHSVREPGPLDAADPPDHTAELHPELLPHRGSDRRSASRRHCPGDEDHGPACPSSLSSCQSPSCRTCPCESSGWSAPGPRPSCRRPALQSCPCPSAELASERLALEIRRRPGHPLRSCLGRGAASRLPVRRWPAAEPLTGRRLRSAGLSA